MYAPPPQYRLSRRWRHAISLAWIILVLLLALNLVLLGELQRVLRTQEQHHQRLLYLEQRWGQ
jgi:hypothetical protein